MWCVCVCMCGGYLTVSVDDWLLAYYIGDISRAVACIVAFRLSSFLMVVWLECLGPLQLPGSAHWYLQVIKKPSDSSEELQSISNEAGSSNGIKSRTIASAKETARFAKLRQWIDYFPVSISISSKMLVPQWTGWFSHIFSTQEMPMNPW